MSSGVYVLGGMGPEGKCPGGGGGASASVQGYNYVLGGKCPGYIHPGGLSCHHI